MNFTKNAVFSENSVFFTFYCGASRMGSFDPKKRRHRVKVLAFGEKMEEFHPFSLKTYFSENSETMLIFINFSKT